MLVSDQILGGTMAFASQWNVCCSLSTTDNQSVELISDASGNWERTVD